MRGGRQEPLSSHKPRPRPTVSPSTLAPAQHLIQYPPYIAANPGFARGARTGDVDHPDSVLLEKFTQQVASCERRMKMKERLAVARRHIASEASRRSVEGRARR